jgi:IS30 family transposase
MSCGKKLTKADRLGLYRLSRMSPKLSLRGIARELGVCHSTVVRELRRSSKVFDRHDDYYTQAQKAQEAAHQRRVAASKQNLGPILSTDTTISRS